MLECSRRLAREDRQLPIGPKPPVSVDCRDDGRFAIARTHGSHPVVGTVSADTLAHCFLSSADLAFLSHDRVSSAPCLRAAAQSHAATSTGIHTHLRALGRHWLHSQRGGVSCVFVCAQDRPTPHTAALTARLPHAHGGGCCGRSDSGLRRFGVVKCRLWCVLAIATTGACIGLRVAAGEHAGRGPFEQAPKAPPFRRKTVAHSKITADIRI